MSKTTGPELLNSMLNEGMVAVVLDPSKPGVRLPPHLMADKQVILNLSYRFGSAYMVELGDDGVSAHLSFRGVPFACFVPWGALIGMKMVDTKPAVPEKRRFGVIQGGKA